MILKIIISLTMIFNLNYGGVNLPLRMIRRTPNIPFIFMENKVEEKEYQAIKKNILLTSYYKGDETGSGSCTGTGLCTSDFDTNDKGWYTYNNYVVVAAATNECYKSKYGACAKYVTPPQDFEVHSYYDLISFEFNEERFTGIILDSCGACSTKNSYDLNGYQRFDIFASSPQSAVGKVQAKLIMYKEVQDE